MNLREAIPNFFWGRDAKKAVEPIEYPRTPTPYEYIRSIPKIGRTPDKVTSILTTGHPRIIGAAEFDPKLFESKSFRIDSSNWREVTFPDGTRAKIHPKYDVTELLDGPYAGEQHFSFDAMLRETRNL